MKCYWFFHNWFPLRITKGLRMRNVRARKWCSKCKTHQIKKLYQMSWMTTGCKFEKSEIKDQLIR